MQLLSKSKTLLATLVIAAFASGAQADVVQIKANVVGTTQYVDLMSTTDNSYTGPAALWSVHNQTTDERFLAYCLELMEGTDQANTQIYTSGAYVPSANVQELYDRSYGSVLLNPSNAVGFQLALWELIGAGDASTFVGTLTNGVAVAEQMLNAVLVGNTAYTPGQYTYTLWSSVGFQDVLQATPVGNAVPEPQTHALMLGGLGLMAMGMVSRRRKTRTDR